jgi:hypothetical protein
MSYRSASPRSHQIDVIDAVGRAYRAVFDNIQLVGEMALLPYLIVLGIELLTLLIPSAVFFGGFFLAMAGAISFLVFGTVFVVRWYRFLLLGESVAGGLIPPGWTDFLIASIKFGILVFAAWLIVFGVGMLPPRFLTLPLSMAGGVAPMLLSLRFVLIFPAAAIKESIPLRTAWDWIEDNFWRLFASVLACYLPFLVVHVVIGTIASAFPTLFAIVFEALNLAVSFVAVAVTAALLAQLYRDIAGTDRRV